MHPNAPRVARWLLGPAVVFALMLTAPAANAAITSVFSNTPTPIPCTVQGSGVRLCDQTTFVPAQPRSTVKAFDGVPIDVRVAFPPEPALGPDGPYPLIMQFHGYAGSKLSLASMQPWLDRGYATFSMSTRGFGQSCGSSASRTADPVGCAAGHVRLMDTRYEVRDAQDFAGLLADEGRTSFTQIGAIGGSYGGGTSMALAALKNRQMLPNGSLVSWVSPVGAVPMSLAAATPEIPWTDLAYSLTPNGGTLDYVEDAPYQGRSGALKSSWENALYNSGLASGFYAAAGADPDADLRNWHTTFNNGEPYDDASGNPLPAVADIRDELTTHHSSYYIDHSIAPAPLLISNGFTDDLFPVDEALRYYNRTITQYPNADLSLYFMSFGHQRGQNKAAERVALSAAEAAWMDFYVKGAGSTPFHGVTTFTQTCPNATASAGPFTAATWADLAPGEIRFDSDAPQTILPTAGSTAISNPYDPITGGGACATTTATDQADLATYRMDPVPTGGFTLMGSPTVVADITSPSENSQIAARLLDVDTSTNTQTLVARGLWRPAITATPKRQVFQLHPNGYRFADGHVVKLELLPKDTNYGRASNGQQNVMVENLQLRLPVLEHAGSLDGLVQDPAPRFVPDGYELAPAYGFRYPRPGSATPLRVPLVTGYAQCTSPDTVHVAPLTLPSCSQPAQESTLLTSSSDGRGAGYVRLNVIVGDPGTAADEADIGIVMSTSDVRNSSDSSDYTGQVILRTAMRITDRSNGSGADPGTVQDVDFSLPVDCVATANPRAGSMCSVNTTADTLVPGFAREGGRAVISTESVSVLDAGPDDTLAPPVGDCPPACGSGDESTFLREGVLAP
jgi:Acetyl xylan esterase (AXE1)